jgi:hypothetical protein
MKHKEIFTIGRTIALLGAILLAVSAFLPWGASAYISVTGTGGDGLITIAIGILAFLLLFIKRITIWFSLFLGAVGLTIGIIDFVAMLNATKLVVEGVVGIGLYSNMLASLGIVIGTVIEIFQERSKKMKAKLAYLDDE